MVSKLHSCNTCLHEAQKESSSSNEIFLFECFQLCETEAKQVWKIGHLLDMHKEGFYTFRFGLPRIPQRLQRCTRPRRILQRKPRVRHSGVSHVSQSKTILPCQQTGGVKLSKEHQGLFRRRCLNTA